jgi:hypothetical protein
MSARTSSLSGLLALVALPSLAAAGQLTSAPLSHPLGFQKVECHLVNGGTKDLVVNSFFIDDVNSSTGFGSSVGGPCTGLPPWTIPPKRGCSRDLIITAACDQPNACFCYAEFSGSAKNVRGNFIGTVNGSTLTLTEELR